MTLCGYFLILGALVRAARYFLNVHYFKDELTRQTHFKGSVANEGIKVEADGDNVAMVHVLDWAITLLVFLQGVLTVRGATKA